MDKRMIMMSNLDLWSIGEGKGAPSFYNTVKAYVDNGWDVTLIQPFSRYRKTYNVAGCSMVKFNHTVFDFFNRIPKVRFFARFIASPVLTSRFYKTAAKIINENKGGCVLYAYEVDAVMPGKKLSSKYHLPLITRFQGTILKDFKDTRLQRIRKFNHYKALELKSDMIIMTDDGTEGDKVLQRLGNKTEKIFFWKNGQDIPLNESFFDTRNAVRDQLEISRTAPVLLTVSRLQNWKRVDRAINAMPDVLKRFPDCKLVIVGGGEEYENLKSLAEKTGVQDSVIFTGPVEQKDVWKYYSCADIFLSLYDLSNLGNPLMEAMRYGKAIITLNIGETYKVIENEVNGILLKQEPFDVSSAIVRLLTDKKLKNMLGENAKEYAKRNFWSWEERMKAEVDAVNALREDF